MDIQTAAWALLILRLISAGFLLHVLLIQGPLLRAVNDRHVIMLRFILFFLAATLFLANIIPILVDVLTIVGEVDRSTNTLKPVSIAYTFSNASFAMVTGVLVWLIYKVTKMINDALQDKNDVLQADNDQLHEDAK